MIVYVLIREEREDSTIVGVFDVEDNAYAKAKKMGLRFFRVEEWEVQ